jgi:hypothetical protein
LGIGTIPNGIREERNSRQHGEVRAEFSRNITLLALVPSGKNISAVEIITGDA